MKRAVFQAAVIFSEQVPGQFRQVDPGICSVAEEFFQMLQEHPVINIITVVLFNCAYFCVTVSIGFTFNACSISS